MSDDKTNQDLLKNWKTHDNAGRIGHLVGAHDEFRIQLDKLLKFCENGSIKEAQELFQEHKARLVKHHNFEESKMFPYFENLKGLPELHGQHDHLLKSSDSTESTLKDYKDIAPIKDYVKEVTQHLDDEEAVFIPLMLNLSTWDYACTKFDEAAFVEKKWKKRQEESEKEEKVKELLPIKTPDGKIVVPKISKDENLSKKSREKREQVEKKEEEEEKENQKQTKAEKKRKLEEKNEATKKPKYEHSALSPTQKQEKIANLCTSILEMPVERIQRLDKIFTFCRDPNLQIQKLSVLSLVALYVDLIPDYRINLDRHQTDVKHKKDLEESYQYEKSLFANYQNFVQWLFKMKDNHNMTFVCIKAMCDLLQKKQHFNFAFNIVKTLVPHLNDSNPKIAKLVFDCFTEVFQNDTTEYQLSRDTVEAISEFVSNRKYLVSDNVTNTFLFLKLSTQLEEEKENHFQKNQAQCLSSIIVLYVRLLKSNHNSPLLFSILTGLSKYSHLINIDLLSDLMGYMKIILEMGNLPLDTFLQTIITSAKLRLGLGMALNLDFGEYYTQLYRIIPTACRSYNERVARLLIDALYLMLVKFKMTKSRAAAFVKRILTWSLYTPLHVSLEMVHMAKFLMNKYPTIKNEMISGDEAGIGLYDPDVDQPDHSNPFSTNLWEYGPLDSYFSMKSLIEGDIKELSSEEYQELFSVFDEITFQKNHQVRKGGHKFKTPFFKLAETKLIQE